MNEPPIERFDDARHHAESTLKPIEERVSPGARAVQERLADQLILDAGTTYLDEASIILRWFHDEEEKNPWSLRAAMRHAKEGRL